VRLAGARKSSPYFLSGFNSPWDERYRSATGQTSMAIRAQALSTGGTIETPLSQPRLPPALADGRRFKAPAFHAPFAV
jgi:hypothetical protein